MYINHNKIEQEEEKYVEVKAKAKVKEPVNEPKVDKNKIFVEGMLKRMDNEKYI